MAKENENPNYIFAKTNMHDHVQKPKRLNETSVVGEDAHQEDESVVAFPCGDPGQAEQVGLHGSRLYANRDKYTPGVHSLG